MNGRILTQRAIRENAPLDLARRKHYGLVMSHSIKNTNVKTGTYSGTWSGHKLTFTVTGTDRDSLVELDTGVGIRGKCKTVVTVTADEIRWI